MKKLVISAIGKDQPGIVGAFTQVLYEGACNIEDTSMTILEDHFTMLFIVTVPTELTESDLRAKLNAVADRFQLQLDIHPVDVERETVGSSGHPWMISVSGPDQTGITYHVSRYLGEQGINIRQLTSKRLTRPSGEILFLMAMEVDVPQSFTEDRLQTELNAIAEAESLEIHAEPLEVYTL